MLWEITEVIHACVRLCEEQVYDLGVQNVW
jgi:hypothetical protein